VYNIRGTAIFTSSVSTGQSHEYLILHRRKAPGKVFYGQRMTQGVFTPDSGV
jgi:hypothetical protein